MIGKRYLRPLNVYLDLPICKISKTYPKFIRKCKAKLQEDSWFLEASVGHVLRNQVRRTRFHHLRIHQKHRFAGREAAHVRSR